ncbi:MAG: T9SS type A sorting domain-containing protein [Bacteroidota bacterium]
MRITLLFTIFLFLYSGAHAQYTPMLEDGSEWYYYFFFESSCNEILSVQGDSLINGLVYKKIHNNLPCIHDNVTLLREDVETKQVFQRDSWNDTEVLIYDYSKEVGDTLFFGPFYNYTFLVLDSISSILPEDNSCPGEMSPMTTLADPKVFYWSSSNELYRQIIWIEGIGNITDPLNSHFAWSEGALGDQVLCHLDSDGVRDYHDISFLCEEPSPCQGPELIGSTVNIYSANYLKVYPNPATDEITIEWKDDQLPLLEQITFFDISGQRLSQQTISSNEFVHIANFPTGLIIGIVTTKDGTHYRLKFIKH